jgi:tetratricopeptide (TPR) repeat protein
MTAARRPLLLLACALALAVARPALGAPSKKEEARLHFDRAEIQYKLGRFQEALDAYTRAFEIYPVPALLFDIGQCHRNLKHYDRAIFFFEGYLREETNPARRKLAQQLIAELKTQIEKQRATPVLAPPPEALAPTPHAAPAPEPEPVAPKVTALAAVEPPRAEANPAPTLVSAPARAEDQTPAQRPVTSRWWFWTAIGAGALAVAAGLFVYYESGTTTTTLPGGSVGTLDRR